MNGGGLGGIGRGGAGSLCGARASIPTGTGGGYIGRAGMLK